MLGNLKQASSKEGMQLVEDLLGVELGPTWM